ncbi:unnamed protein product [Polarella glacialis]|uniref:Non-specific serine/threonine protein kinase n=1 Tax=Polarella glacialis TaxID=89957 RepID=A0A813JS48_POLGL|nr:unnamed protein product [Polarella glacialis]CAE8683747.1 unnamed protein product [Polarella glacialis]|mmetsp:Transcript_64314/g.104024  ORF Transcript_64314/g.104024 Transcript_64314/m.104024 type:complete len:593 (-) Transcript_64314:110-1888(-)
MGTSSTDDIDQSATLVCLVFHLQSAETQLGETIRLVGAGAALGHWDPEQSVALYTDATRYPCWSTEVWLPVSAADGQSAEQRLEYKYLRDQRALGKGIAWEDDIGNRCVELSPILEVTAASSTVHIPETGKRHEAVAKASGAWLVHDHRWGLLDASVLRPTPLSLEDVSTPFAALAMDLFTPTRRQSLSHLSACSPSPSRSVSLTTLPLGRSGSQSLLERRRNGSISLLNELPPQGSSGESIEQCASEACQLVREESASCLNMAVRLIREESMSCLPPSPMEEVQGSSGEEPPPDAEPDSFEARYLVLGEPLGEGSFGLVYRCRQRRIEANGKGDSFEERAAKRIAKARLAPRDMRNLFGFRDLEGEIRLHLGLNHPNIIRLYEAYDDPVIVSLVLECCSGGDLFDLISGHTDVGGLSEPAACRVLLHVLSALKYLHDQPIIHRDVKCENVLMAEPVGHQPDLATFKLCDLGFAARPRPPCFILRTRMGSPDTVAPEIIRGEVYGTPVDCWAAGVLLFMALSACPPFFATSDAEVMHKVKLCQYSVEGGRWDTISKEAKEMVCKLMTLSTEDRASASEALQLPFFRQSQEKV